MNGHKIELEWNKMVCIQQKLFVIGKGSICSCHWISISLGRSHSLGQRCEIRDNFWLHSGILSDKFKIYWMIKAFSNYTFLLFKFRASTLLLNILKVILFCLKISHHISFSHLLSENMLNIAGDIALERHFDVNEKKSMEHMT